MNRLQLLCVCILLTLMCSEPSDPNHITQSGIRNATPSNLTLAGLFFMHVKGTESDNCGDFHAPGLAHAQAMIYAIEKINNDPNLLPNVTLGYDIHDYCESASLAMKSTYQFVKRSDSHFVCAKESLLPHVQDNRTLFQYENPIISLIGPSDSGSSVLVGSLLKVAGISAVSFGATSEELSSPLYKHFFRTVPSDKQQASVMADLLEYFEWSYVASVAVDDSYGRYGVWAMEKESFQRRTFCIGLSEYVPRLNYMSKLEMIVSKLKAHPNIKVVVLWLFGGYGMAFLEEAERQKLRGRTWILSDALAAESPTRMRSLFGVLDGALGVQPLFHHSLDFESYLKTFTLRDIVQKRIPAWWDMVWISQFNCSALNSTGFEPCEENLTLTTDAVRKIYDTYLPYVIDAVYAVAHALHAIYTCAEPYGLLPGGRCPRTQPSVLPLDVDLYLRNVSFDGLVGRVEFDESGDPLTSSYDVINFQCRFENDVERNTKEFVGFWEKNAKVKLRVELDKVKWTGKSLNSSIPASTCSEVCPPGTVQSATTACCWECTECPVGTISKNPGSSNCTPCAAKQRANQERTHCEELPIVNVKWTDVTGTLITGFTSLGVVLTLFSAIVFTRHRHTPLVKASSRELSAILLISIATYFAQAFLYLTPPSNTLCRLTYCFNYVAMGTCVATLLIKTLRILGAFHSNLFGERAKRCFLATEIQASSILLLNTVVFSLLTIWLLLDAPYMSIVIQRGEFIFFICRPHRFTVGFSLHVTINGYILLLSLVCTFHAFKARKLPENYNEARYIGLSMYILLLSTIAYYPVDFAGLENWSVTIVTCVTTLVSSYGLLGCMFAPKLYVILFHPEQNTAAAVRTQVSDYTFRQSQSLPASQTVNPSIVMHGT